MPQYQFTNYSEEKVEKGKTGYYKMAVNYSAKGEPKQKVIMSFANPAVYDTIKKLNGGETMDVSFVEGDTKYYNWASVKVVGDASEAPQKAGGELKSAGPTQGTARSTYETPEERARKQVYIIKQSCLAQAAAYSSLRSDGYPTVQEHIELAQKLVDWVLDEPKQDVFNHPNDL